MKAELASPHDYIEAALSYDDPEEFAEFVTHTLTEQGAWPPDADQSTGLLSGAMISNPLRYPTWREGDITFCAQVAPPGQLAAYDVARYAAFGDAVLRRQSSHQTGKICRFSRADLLDDTGGTPRLRLDDLALMQSCEILDPGVLLRQGALRERQIGHAILEALEPHIQGVEWARIATLLADSEYDGVIEDTVLTVSPSMAGRLLLVGNSLAAAISRHRAKARR